MNRRYQVFTQQAGVTLLELLVTLVVVSLGMLGVAGLQAKSLQSNHDSYMYSKASFLVHDIAERMRTNPPGVRGGDYAISTNSLVGNELTNGQGTQTKVRDCSSVTCDPDELARFDLYEWLEQRIKTTLPDGAAIISASDWDPAAGSGTAPTVDTTITLRWRGRAGGNCDANGSTATNDKTYRCFTVNVSL